MIKHLKPRSKYEIANKELQNIILDIIKNKHIEIANNQLKEVFKYKKYSHKGFGFGLSHFRNSRAAQEIF